MTVDHYYTHRFKQNFAKFRKNSLLYLEQAPIHSQCFQHGVTQFYTDYNGINHINTNIQDRFITV